MGPCVAGDDAVLELLGLSVGDVRREAILALEALATNPRASHIEQTLALRALGALCGWVEVVGRDRLEALERDGARKAYRRLPPAARAIIGILYGSDVEARLAASDALGVELRRIA